MRRIVHKNVISLSFNSCSYCKYIFRCIYAKLIGFSMQFYYLCGLNNDMVRKYVFRTHK